MTYCGQLQSAIRGRLGDVIETSARLLSLLALLQARRDWSGGELADRLDVGVRTVRRDVDRLRRLGYPIAASPGVAGGYRLGAGATLPPLLLDADEAVAVAVGLRTTATVGVAGIEETSIRALAKLEQLLPAGLRRRVSALGAATVPYPSAGPTVDAEALATTASASPTAVMPASRAGVWSSPTDWFTPAGGGISSPGMSIGPTGGRSGSTGSDLA
jgi:biotin operon repressor